MATEYYDLWDGIALARLETVTGKIERWDDGEWYLAYSLAPEILGREHGAVKISAERAEELKTTVPKALPESKAHWH